MSDTLQSDDVCEKDCGHLEFGTLNEALKEAKRGGIVEVWHASQQSRRGSKGL